MTSRLSLLACWMVLGSGLLSGCLDTAHTAPTDPAPPAGGPVIAGPAAGVAAGHGGNSANASGGSLASPPSGEAGAAGADGPAGNMTDAAGSSAAGAAGVVAVPGTAAGSTQPPTATSPDDKWIYHQVSGAVCRDGSPAGYYVRRGSESNLMVFLNGGGVCYDDFFCGLNPANVNESLPAEDLGSAALDGLTNALLPMPQTPPDDGILKRDPRNPVGNWSMVFVPYCTGDVFAGTTPDAEVLDSATLPPQQFVGYTNLGLIYEDLAADLRDPPQLLLAGSSAGSFGVLLNYDRTQHFFERAKVLALADSGFAFRDEFLEPCLQKHWRNLWGIDNILPPGCKGCFNPDGGGLAEGLGQYLFKEQYKDRFIGGAVSSTQDQIMKLFFASGLNECLSLSGVDALAAFLGLSAYPKERYPAGLHDFIENVSGRDQIASYLIDSDLHQHIIGQRFYADNGLDRSIAQWLEDVLQGKAEHLE